MKQTMYNALLEYGKSDMYPFHMPGHKRNVCGVNPYSYDITEIDGFDNLHEPEDMIADELERARRIYGTKKTYFLVNGSTCGILSAICALTYKGDKFLAARNCHKAVYNGIYMNELEPVYIYPEYLKKLGISGVIKPEDVEKCLNENPDIKVVMITSPTYEGIVSDVEKIAEIVHQRNGILIVDEAHGAHFFLNDLLSEQNHKREFPESAVNYADVVIQSVHKTLPAMTQTALLHICSDRVSQERIERYLKIYQSSSPSYVLMASIVNSYDILEKSGKELVEKYLENLKWFYEEVQKLHYIKVFTKEDFEDYRWDISKIIISARDAGFNGTYIYDKLREDYRIQLEMCAGDYCLAMTSVMDTREGFERLQRALLEIDNEISELIENRVIHELNSNVTENQIDAKLPVAEIKRNLFDALNDEKEFVKLEDALGRVSADFIHLYPPGIPLIAPGEVYSDEVIRRIRDYERTGLTVHGMTDDTVKVIR